VPLEEGESSGGGDKKGNFGCGYFVDCVGYYCFGYYYWALK